jgi:ribosome-interacting GTPase 1
LNVIRIYTKAPGKPADNRAPFTLPRGGTVEDLAALVHRDLAQSVKFARISSFAATLTATLSLDLMVISARIFRTFLIR